MLSEYVYKEPLLRSSGFLFFSPDPDSLGDHMKVSRWRETAMVWDVGINKHIKAQNFTIPPQPSTTVWESDINPGFLDKY